MEQRILIIEDETRIARVLELELRHEGYQVAVAGDGMQGEAMASQTGWSCILLDLQLPGMDGFEVLERLRAKNPHVPVLIMTARGSLSDKVKGLDLGANDYVTKPFEMEEVSARIRALLRSVRREPSPSSEQEEVLMADGLIADTKARSVQREGKAIELTPREFDLLVYLMKHKGQVLSRDQILSDVWGFDFAGQTNLVDVYIRYLRQKLEQGIRKKLIHTIRGVGYSMKEPEP